MKRLLVIAVVMILMSGIVMAAVTVRAGIFSAGTQTINVMAKPVGGGVISTISSISIPIAWETASGITITNVDYAPGLQQTDVGTSGIYSYAVYSLMPGTAITWAEGSENVILTLTISGTGPALMMLNDVSGVGWYFETGLGDLTDYGTPFYVNSTELALPVTLTSFAAKLMQNGTGVVLQWATASEVNNYGYTVQRKAEADETFTDVAGAFVEGHGTTVEPQTYSYTDNSVLAAGKYQYRLKQQDLNGAVQYSQSVIVNVSVTDVAEAAPREFALMQNYPNPFNPTTMVKFSVPSTGRATMKVYNTVGQEVVTLFEGVAEAGRYYAVPFNAASLASGVYFYRLVTEQKTDVRRMMLVK
ncbi:MAG: T9SS type A sorting domain-containing protein [Ignavibacteriae bacterium]|nr:T9SS type A sorting domain-containing protein [Ignavibacteriota bacterium]